MAQKLWEKNVKVDQQVEAFTVGKDREMDLYLAKYDVLGSMAHITMLESIGLLVFFLIICFIIGIYFLPTFFKKTRQYFNDETLLIVSLGLCLSMVVLASKMGFSSAHMHKEKPIPISYSTLPPQNCEKVRQINHLNAQSPAYPS